MSTGTHVRVIGTRGPTRSSANGHRLFRRRPHASFSKRDRVNSVLDVPAGPDVPYCTPPHLDQLWAMPVPKSRPSQA